MRTRFLIFQIYFWLRCTIFLTSQRNVQRFVTSNLPLAIGYTNFYCPERLKMSTPSIFCTNTPYLVSFYKNKVSSRHQKSSRLSGFWKVWNLSETFFPSQTFQTRDAIRDRFFVNDNHRLQTIRMKSEFSEIYNLTYPYTFNRKQGVNHCDGKSHKSHKYTKSHRFTL